MARKRLAALATLLLANYLFYARWDIWYLALIPLASSADYCISHALSYVSRDLWRRVLVGASIALNIGLIIAIRFIPGVALPLTLSFYAFQALTYTIDIYRGEAKPAQSYLAYLAAVSFFPTTLAGPIARVSRLLNQFEKRQPISEVNGSKALFLIAMGLIKKLLIADYLASNFVNRVFDFPALYTGSENLMAVYAYTVQIYCDFSGYTDIALGSAMLLGIALPPNFHRPYAALNLADFWRRWHISLSNWLRDYLYFALPGQRTAFMPYVNLIITMVLAGFWHGASWTFVVWGALHGVGLAVVRALQIRRPTRGAPPPGFTVGKAAAWFVTFHFVALSWIFFRAQSLETAWAILGRIASATISFENVSGPIVLVLLIGFAAHYVPSRWYDQSQEAFVRAPFYAQAVALLLLVLGLQMVVSSGAAPFIYTRF